MLEFECTVTNKTGIHARPAGMLVKEANRFTSDISIQIGDKKADCKKIFSVMALAVKSGESVCFTISGEDEDAAKIAIKTFFADNLQ